MSAQTVSQFNDSILLKHYLHDGNEGAFAELVERYQSLVLGAAFRRAGDAELARDVAQQVFAALARKAKLLMDRDSLAGWLHQATMYETCRALQSEGRRRQRYAQLQLEQPEPSVEYVNEATEWAILDEAVDRLAFADREAIAMHYFQDLSYPEMAEVLGVSEPAVRKRVSRALQRLGDSLRERGVRQTAAALLTGALALQNTLVVPAGLAQGALALAAAGGGASAFLSLTAVMSKTVVKTAAAIVAAALVYTVWPTGKSANASPNADTISLSAAAAAEETASGSSGAIKDTPLDQEASATGLAAGGSSRGIQRIATRLRGGSADSNGDASRTRVSADPAQLAETIGERLAERLAPPGAGIPGPIPDQTLSLEVSGVTPSPDIASLDLDGINSTVTALLADIPNLPDLLQGLESLPSAAAEFYSDILSTALGLTPVEQLRVRDVLEDHFTEQALSGLAGINPLNIADQQLQGYRSALIDDTVERVIEAAPVAGSVPHIVEEVLHLGDGTLLGEASSGGGDGPDGGNAGNSESSDNPGDASQGGDSLPEILTGRLPLR